MPMEPLIVRPANETLHSSTLNRWFRHHARWAEQTFFLQADLILVYHPLVSIYRIQYQNLVIHQCQFPNSPFDEPQPSRDDDDAGADALARSPNDYSMGPMKMSSSRVSGSWNRLIGRTTVFDWDSSPIVDARRNAIDVGSESLARCPVCEGERERMPPPNRENERASNRPK